MDSGSDSEIRLRNQAERLNLLGRPSSKSEVMQGCLELAQVAAKTLAPVMITGESGVGKSVLAASIHFNSPKRGLPCVTLRCSTDHERNVKARLLGDRKSQSTGEKGLLERAAGGTLIIDAVDQLPGFIQKELLTVLTDIGGRAMRADAGAAAERRQGYSVRLISTSGSELSQKSAHGLFVEDLMYRLGEITIRMPPLRDRREDIPDLAIQAVKAANYANGKNVKGLSRTASDFIRHYDFPGNVRELFLIINRAVRKTMRDTLYVEDLGLVIDSAEEHPHMHSDLTLLSLSEMEKRHINKALLRAGWNKRAAARILRISETMLNRKIKLYGLERDTRLD